mgnify:FL=1
MAAEAGDRGVSDRSGDTDPAQKVITMLEPADDYSHEPDDAQKCRTPPDATRPLHWSTARPPSRQSRSRLAPSKVARNRRATSATTVTDVPKGTPRFQCEGTVLPVAPGDLLAESWNSE